MSDTMPAPDMAEDPVELEELVDESKVMARIPRELGTTGLRKFAGVVLEEFMPHLRGERGRAIFQEMGSNDPVLFGVLHTFEMLLRGAKLTVRPAEIHSPGDEQTPEAFDVNVVGETFPGTPQREVQTEEAEAVAAFVEECFDDMSHSFGDFIGQIASMFQYGWAFFEIVYKKREGDNTRSPGKASRFDDGRIGWRKFAPRSQNTLYEWEFDKNGGLDAFWQLDPYRHVRSATEYTLSDSILALPAGTLRIPIEKGLLFTTTQASASPEGKSLLRGAYRPWYFKKRIEEIEAIGIERDLAGLPVIHAPMNIFGPNASEDGKAMFADLSEAVQNIRRDQQDGLVFPVAFDNETGKELFKFELLSTGGSRQLDTNDIVTRKNMEMAMSVLADFMAGGQGESGASSFALSQDKTNLFAMALDSYLQSVAEVLMRHAVPRLLRVNGIDTSLSPILTFEAVRAPTLTELGEYIQRLARAGAPFFPDARLQNFLYERAGMPPPSPSQEQEEVDGGENDGSLMPEGDGSFEDTGTGEPLDPMAPDAEADPTSNNDTASRLRDAGKPKGQSSEFFDE